MSTDKSCCAKCVEHKRTIRAQKRRILRLQKKIGQDSLTGLANYQGFQNALRRELSRAQRKGGMLCVALLDLDHFKDVNDTFGHPVGNKVLTKLGELLRWTCRATDIAARIGGEEFCIILPETTLDGAHLFIERLREIIADKLVVKLSDDRMVRCTASFGVGLLVPGRSVQDQLAEIDKALYYAKSGGRNKVEVVPKLATL